MLTLTESDRDAHPEAATNGNGNTVRRHLVLRLLERLDRLEWHIERLDRIERRLDRIDREAGR